MSVQLDTAYIITHPDSTRAVIGNSAAAIADADWCGWLDDLSGFESAEIRGSSEPIASGDGAIPGNYYDGERPFSFTVKPAPDPSATLNTRIDKLLHATDCKRQDGTVDWTETGRAQTRLWFRRHQAPRFSDVKRPKTLLIPMVSANSRILSSTEHSSGPSTSLSVTNAGTRETLPRLTIASPSATVNITNSTTGETLTFTGLSGGGTVTIDFSPPYPSLTQGGVSKYGAVAFPSSIWWALQPGVNSISCTNAATIFWRDAW